MIIPSSLQPLPVAPASEEEAAVKALESEAFVSDRSVRQLLVGPLSVGQKPTVVRSIGDDFVGRVESPFVSLAGSEGFTDAPAKAFAPSGPHPALAAPRRAAPPVPRTGVESSFGRRIGSDRRLVLGMGLAAVILMVAAVFSGFVPLDFSPEEPSPAVETAPAQSVPAAASAYASEAIAFTLDEAAMP